MRYVALILFMSACGNPIYTDTNDKADHELSAMRSPVILIGKKCDSFGWNIVLRDSTGRVESFGNLQIIANTIGESRNIGDTIK